jgi:hypothetical protein
MPSAKSRFRARRALFTWEISLCNGQQATRPAANTTGIAACAVSKILCREPEDRLTTQAALPRVLEETLGTKRTHGADYLCREVT